MVRLGPFSRPIRALRSILPPFNFITIHYTYFLATCLISAIIFWGSSTPARSISFTDSLFLTVSAMTLAGLNTVNLSTLNTFQQFLLFLLIMLGSAIFVSAFVVQVRRTAFEKRFKDVIQAQRQSRAKSQRQSRGRSTSRRRTFSLRRGDSSADNGAKLADETVMDPTGDSSDKHQSDSSTTPGAVALGRDAEIDSARDQTPPARRGEPEMNRVSSEASRPYGVADPPHSPDRSSNPGITFRKDTRFGPSTIPSSPPTRHRRLNSLLSLQGVGARSSASLDAPTNGRPLSSTSGAAISDSAFVPRTRGDVGRYFESVGGWISRNSEFHGLTAHEREKLGGYEYRAVSFLAWLVPVYFVAWQLLGCLGCAAWVAMNQPDTAYVNGLNPWWVGAFNAVSAFNNSGMSLLDANMVAFQSSYYLLITMSLLILAGNTCYPIFLRLIIRGIHQISSRLSGEAWAERSQTLQFLLEHPRRCYTNLFPAQHTWWLLLSVTILNGVDWAAFEILNLHNDLLNSQLPTNLRVIDGLFQAFAVRSGGFYVVPIVSVRVSLQVLYVVMMYISVYPVVITMRNSNVYEERSLGIYADDPEEDRPHDADRLADDKRPAAGVSKPGLARRAATLVNHFVASGAGRGESNGQFVRHQLRAQLAHDAWWIVLALFLIVIIENEKFVEQPAVFSVFNFLFEIVSAYGCVGISVGVPWNAYSFCGAWQALSKLVLCAVMLAGRHRGLPVAIDKAILLPGEEHWRAEEDDGRIRMARTLSQGRPELV